MANERKSNVAAFEDVKKTAQALDEKKADKNNTYTKTEVNDIISDLQAHIGYTDDDIYGLEADFKNRRFTRIAGAANKTGGEDFDDIRAFGGRRRCNVTNDGKVIAYYGNSGFSDSGFTETEIVIDSGKNAGTYETGTPVQVMVEQPKFYYKVVPLELEQFTDAVDGKQGYHLRKARYYVTDTPKAGFKVHPAFIRNGVENDYIYLSAFEGCLYDISENKYILDDAQVADFSKDYLSSIAGARPVSGLSQSLYRSNSRSLAHNRGGGWELMYAATISASQLLMIIEYASFDSQSVIGKGVGGKTSSNTELNDSEITGATASLGNETGKVESNGFYIPSYRGEENIWGNIWKWIDGMNMLAPGSWAKGEYCFVYVADHDFADNISGSPYVDTGIYACYTGGGWINAFGYSEKSDYLFIPTECGNGASASLPVGSYFNNSGSNWKLPRIGGCWTDSSGSGAFQGNCNLSRSAKGAHTSARLVYIPSGAK